MNIPRVLIAILATFVFIFVSDFLIHGVWLAHDYGATKEMWRSDPEMNARMPWMLAAHFLGSAMFVIIWARGFFGKNCLSSAVIFGLCMGLFAQVNTLIMYVVSPLPASMAVSWFVSGVAQSMAVGVIVYFILRPKAT